MLAVRARRWVSGSPILQMHRAAGDPGRDHSGVDDHGRSGRENGHGRRECFLVTDQIGRVVEVGARVDDPLGDVTAVLRQPGQVDPGAQDPVRLLFGRSGLAGSSRVHVTMPPPTSPSLFTARNCGVSLPDEPITAPGTDVRRLRMKPAQPTPQLVFNQAVQLTRANDWRFRTGASWTADTLSRRIWGLHRSVSASASRRGLRPSVRETFGAFGSSGENRRMPERQTERQDGTGQLTRRERPWASLVLFGYS